jgi:murein DD-endopeptidase MepM/ murein hydrolase activator NlpD
MPARHYAGRHRVSTPGVRRPLALGRASMLPTATAAALVVTAGGFTVAQQVVLAPPTAEAVAAPASLDLSVQQLVAVRTEQAAQTSTAADLAVRRQAGTMQTAASRGRAEAKHRAAVLAQRKAAAEKAALAKKAKAEAKARAQARAKKAAARAKQAAARAAAVREGRRWVSAIRSGRLTSDYGPRWGKTHDGLDIGAPTGTPLYAMSRGTVILAGRVPSFGGKVEIRYWDGTVSWYGHMSRIDVREGESVMPGELVGAVGNTGHSFGSHLHIEIHPTGGDNPVNPAPWLRAKGIRLG